MPNIVKETKQHVWIEINFTHVGLGAGARWLRGHRHNQSGTQSLLQNGRNKIT